MNLILHLMKKDLQVARPAWVLWIVVVLIDVTWQAIGVSFFLEGTRQPSSGVSTFRGVLPLVELAVGLLLVSQVIHEDPLVDDNAFWLTRPIPPASLFLSKLFTLALLIGGPPLVAEGLLLAWFRVPVVYATRVEIEIGLALATPVLLAFVAAAITSGPPRYALLLAASVSAYALGLSLLSTFAWRAPAGSYMPPLPGFRDPSRGLCAMLVFLAGVTWVLRWHYRRRDWRAAVALVLLVFGASWLVVRLWPNVSLFGAEPALTAGWAAPSAATLRRADDRLYVGDSPHNKHRIIAAPIVIDGLPADYSATPFTLDGRLEYSDGSRAESRRAGAVQRAAGTEYRPSLTLAHGYGPAPPGSGPTAWEAWPVLVDAPTSLLERKADLPATYHGTFLYRVARHERVASLPLAVGASHVDGPRSLTVDALKTWGSECGVTLRVNAPALAYAGPQEPVLGFHFRDRRTNEVMRAVHEWTSPGTYPAFRMNSSGFGSHYVQVLVEPPDARARPPHSTRAPGAAELSAHCEDLQLVVVRTIPAGTLTRTLGLPDLRIGSPTLRDR